MEPVDESSEQKRRLEERARIRSQLTGRDVAPEALQRSEARQSEFGAAWSLLLWDPPREPPRVLGEFLVGVQILQDDATRPRRRRPARSVSRGSDASLVRDENASTR